MWFVMSGLLGMRAEIVSLAYKDTGELNLDLLDSLLSILTSGKLPSRHGPPGT